MTRSIGNYQLLSEAWRETLGPVFLARHAHLERDHHVLVVDEALAAEPSFRKRFLREMRSVGRLNHPNILRIIDAGVALKSLYVVLDLDSANVPSTTLVEQARLAPVVAYRLGSMITNALMHAHLKGILHRGLHPRNVWVRPDGSAQVGGFGFALAPDPKAAPAAAEYRGFVAPEVLEGAPSDARSDIWSLGAIIAFYLAGNVPFPADSAEEQVKQVAGRRMYLPPEARSALSPEAVRLLQQLLAREPAERPTSLYEIKTELEDLALQQAATRVLRARRRAYEAGARFDAPGGLKSYEILGKLGEGGFGTVYKVRESDSGRAYALKVVKPQQGDDSTAARFRREWEALQSVHHPNIVRVVEVGQAEDVMYFVMEYIDGIDLRRHLQKVGCVPADEAVRIASEVARALGAAHGAGVVHRDLSPSNVLLDAEGRVVLTDFGVAHVAGKSRLTLTGEFMGTPQYMAPEVINGGPPDPRSDLYGLGVILYEMLVGSPPFQDDSVWALLRRIVTEDPDVHQMMSRDMPRLLKTVVLRLLEKDPSHRYTAAAELLADLARVESELDARRAPA